MFCLCVTIDAERELIIFPFYYLFIYLFIYLLFSCHFFMMMIVCDIETGQSNVILDIEESRGPRKFIF